MDASSAISATPTREVNTALERIEQLEHNQVQLAQMVATMAHDLHVLMLMLEKAEVVTRVEGPNDSRLN